MMRTLALLGLVTMIGCLGETPTVGSSSAGPMTTASTTTMTASGTGTPTGTETSEDETHGGMTVSEEDSTGDCLLYDYTEVRGCPEAIGEQFCSEGRGHFEIDTELSWEANPPHSGGHWPMWASWGEHDSTLEREYWIHNLEHGGIVLSYRCPGGCEADVDVLRAVMDMRPDLRILITPDPELPADGFAAISWTWVYGFETPDLDTLLCFVDQHENHAPEDVG